MNNSLTSLAIFGLLGAAVIALPGFAPQVAAGETSVLAKSDRLDCRTKLFAANLAPLRCAVSA
jgi:hypothetical protein